MQSLNPLRDGRNPVTCERSFRELLAIFPTSWRGPADRPEESLDATVRALWFAAAGQPCSAIAAGEHPLPRLSAAQLRRLRRLVRRRLAGVPLAFLTGFQRFMGLELEVRRNVMVPRGETEALVELAVEQLQPALAATGRALVADLCTGCGNVAIALAKALPGCEIHAADLSRAAVELAQANAARQNVQTQVHVWAGDLFAPLGAAGLHGQFNMIVCNPPYLPTATLERLPLEVRNFEPRTAFAAGPFGLDFFVRLLADAPSFLLPQGWLCVEAGLGQARLLAQANHQFNPGAVRARRSDAVVALALRLR